MRIRTTNDNEDRNGNRLGSRFWHGRAWLWSSDGKAHEYASFDWSLFHRCQSSLAMWVRCGSGDSGRGIGFHLAIPFVFSFFLTISNLFPKGWFSYPKHSRRTGWYWYDGKLWIMVWETDDYDSRAPWYSKMIALYVGDWFLGRPKHSEQDHTDWKTLKIPMPEGTYDCEIQFSTHVWKRRFYSKRLRRAEIKCPAGIPFPGKGESSWDCGEDAAYGLTCQAENEWDAIGRMVSSVMRSRIKYGSGTNWRPAPKEPVTSVAQDPGCGTAAR